MPQLLESTRTYLKSSTKLGRRLSNYKDDSSASEASLSEAIVPSTPEGTQQRQHRPLPQNRLSALFTLDGWNKNSVSTEDRVSSSKVRPETFEQLVESVPRLSEDDSKKKKRKSSSSRKSTSTSTSDKISSSSLTAKGLTPLVLPEIPAQTPRSTQRNSEASMPRGRSPTLSVPATKSTPSSHSTGTTSEQQLNTWRRQLLEESIMHSLQLGYGSSSSPRPSSSRHRSRSRSRSLKRSALGRSRKARESKISASMSKDLPPCPTGPDSSLHLRGLQENVVDRGLTVPTGSGHVLQEHRAVNKNSPYQMLLNPSSTNITHSFASFTLELPEHQASHVMSASMVPNLFKIKQSSKLSSADGPTSRSRGRRDSVASNFKLGGNGGNFSPRVLTGKLHSSVDDDAKENRLPTLPNPASVAVV